MSNNLIYSEKVSSTRTEALFLALASFFFWLFIRRMKRSKRGYLTTLFFCLFLSFLFYTVNYKTLVIHLTSEALRLKFGIFTWNVPFDNIADCQLDELPTLMKFGGAGIHFMRIRKRYRASFNFLEYPRVVIALKKKVGPVQDISFSTRHPGEVLSVMQEAVADQRIPQTTT